jgi:hypothetical protein
METWSVSGCTCGGRQGTRTGLPCEENLADRLLSRKFHIGVKAVLKVLVFSERDVSPIKTGAKRG